MWANATELISIMRTSTGQKHAPLVSRPHSGTKNQCRLARNHCHRSLSIFSMLPCRRGPNPSGFLTDILHQKAVRVSKYKKECVVKWLLGIHSPNEFLLLFYVCFFFLLGNQFSFSSRWHPFLLFAGIDIRDPHSPVVPRCRTLPTPLRTVYGTLDFLYHFFNFNLSKLRFLSTFFLNPTYSNLKTGCAKN